MQGRRCACREKQSMEQFDTIFSSLKANRSSLLSVSRNYMFLRVPLFRESDNAPHLSFLNCSARVDFFFVIM